MNFILLISIHRFIWLLRVLEDFPNIYFSLRSSRVGAEAKTTRLRTLTRTAERTPLCSKFKILHDSHVHVYHSTKSYSQRAWRSPIDCIP